MKKLTTLLAATALASMMAGAAWSKTLVYCSEASPEGFDPGLYTGGQTFDATSRTAYNRLVEFKHGSTELEPGLAESWEVSADGKEYTFKLRKGVKFQTTEYFTPTRELNADDVIAVGSSPKEYADKYKGKFDAGWDVWRARILARQKELRVVPANAQLPPRDPRIPAWDSLSPAQKRVYARFMEVYAGYLEYTDEEIGTAVADVDGKTEMDALVAYLQSLGRNLK